MSFGQKGKRFNFFFISTTSGFFLFLLLILYSLYVPLPSPKKPLIFYRSEKRDDLNLLLKKAIDLAQTSITLRTYGLTDPEILSLLKKKAAQGIPVTLYYDQKASPSLEKLTQKNFYFYPLKGKGLIHEKIWVIDETLLFIGSTNLTPSSLRMHANSMVGLYAPPLAQALVNGRPSEFRICVGKRDVQYYSLPSKMALDAVLKTLDRAKKEVSLSFFTLTHPLIGEKLIELHKKGVKINLKLDRGSAEGASRRLKKMLEKEGIPVQKSRGPELFHHKWAIIDKHTHILGSANWTQAAFNKNEDLILIIY